MQPDSRKRKRIGIVVIHGIGEQTRFEHLEAIAGNLFKALSQDPARKPQIQIRRSDQAPLHASTEGWRNAPAVVSWWSEETKRWIDAHFHEATWADLDSPDTISNWLRLVGWGLAMPGLKLVDFTPTFQARQQHVCLPVRLSVGSRFFVRLELFSVSLLFFLMLVSVNMISWILRRLSIRFAPVERAREIIYDYLGDVKLYQDWAIRDDGLEALGEKSRAAVQRRAVRALAAMAEEIQHKRLDEYYIFAHSLGTVIAFNALMELGVTLPNYFNEEEWSALPSAFKTQAGYDAPVPQKPRRPYWLGTREAINRGALFAGLKGLLTMGSPLNKFAAMWPAIVPVNREALAQPVPWINVADRQDIVAGSRITLFRSCDDRAPAATLDGAPDDIAGLRLRNVPWADRLTLVTAHTSYWRADFTPSHPLGRVKERLTGQHPGRLMNRLIPWLETGDGSRFEPPDDRVPAWLAALLYVTSLAAMGMLLAFMPAFLLRWMETLWSGGDEAIRYSLWEAVVETVTHPLLLVRHMGLIISAGILTVGLCSVVRYAWECNRNKWTDASLMEGGSMTAKRIIAALFLLPLAAGVSCKPDSGGPFLKQGWTQEQRQEFYHKSQGTRLIPLPWLLALTQKGGTEPFLADANVARFRFIPDSKHRFNEYGLPVGFAVTQVPSVDDPTKMVPWVGWTCAACHTGRIVANGKTVQIDGAPSMQHNAAFVKAMLEALGETIADNQKLEAFAKAAMGIPAPGPEHKEGLKKKVLELIDRITMKPAVVEARTKCGDPAMKRKYTDPNFTPVPNWGYGRLDAIGRATNTVFAPMHPCNLDTADAPVSIPKTWNAWKYNWVQWNAFVENPLARNLAQALALGADPKTVDLTALGWLESQVEALQPPHWEDVFGPVESKLAEEGKALYHKGRPDRPVKGGLCAHCHVPESHLLKDCDGKAEWKVAMIPVEEIGTDETAAINYTTRFKKPVPNSGLPDPFPPAIAMSAITSKVIAERFDAQKIAEVGQKAMQRCRSNKWLNTKEYKAPTHEGVWATAPYLHNGSVPNLYLMLSPKVERDKQAKVFCIGHDLTYDPTNVGFKLTDQCPDPFKFDTTLRNNGNKGHEFRKADSCEKREGQPGEGGVLGCELSDHERKALVEYLKTL